MQAVYLLFDGRIGAEAHLWNEYRGSFDSAEKARMASVDSGWGRVVLFSENFGMLVISAKGVTSDNIIMAGGKFDDGQWHSSHEILMGGAAMMHKYNVSRVDGRDAPGGDKEDARYFVLDYVHDRYAWLALHHYAVSVSMHNQELSERIMAELNDTMHRHGEQEWRMDTNLIPLEFDDIPSGFDRPMTAVEATEHVNNIRHHVN